MFKMGNIHHMLARLGAVVAAASVILAGISRLIEETLGITQSSYMTLATIAILFAIYFLIEGALFTAEKS